MTATRAQKKELILYVLQTFLDVTEEKPIYLALVKSGLEEINDLLLFRDEDVPTFKYMHKVDDNTEEERSLFNANLCSSLPGSAISNPKTMERCTRMNSGMH
jgi:hypothetical protein